ncbi:MAG: endolytic transglycosylase MltG, partial [Acidobacteriota bacterium]
AAAAMVEEFRSVFGGSWLSRANSLRMTVRQIVTLASLVEEETSIPEEKSLVSAVFHNRLRLGMKLDCDPTIIYALKERGEYEGRLRKKDLSFPSAYNTYLNRGLPPGPICNPGRQALEAALYPAAEGYLYFVSKNDGSHHFSLTFGEHQAAVRRFQKR